MVLQVPHLDDHAYLGFRHPGALDYPELLKAALVRGGGGASPDVWLYTPMAVPFLDALEPALVIYDVMDDLASFAGAPSEMRQRQRELLTVADLVFTGGRSLHASTTAQRAAHVHLFPSGVETSHYARARTNRTRQRPTPVAGYIGVIDERIDLELVHELARSLPDWTIRMVGPIAKIDEAALPRAANIEYPGMVDYAALPEVLAGFDVALMPFARNDATSSISPTKTLEYFAAGLPVVSTRVPDVVADYGEHVHLADTGVQFAACCRRLATASGGDVSDPVRSLLRRQEWDFIAEAMNDLIETTRSRTNVRRFSRRPSVTDPSPAVASPARIRDLKHVRRLPVTSATPGEPHPAAVSRSIDDVTPPPQLCPVCRMPMPCPAARELG